MRGAQFRSWRRSGLSGGAARAMLMSLPLCLAAGAAVAQTRPPAYEFSPPPSESANRVYGVNRTTGEVSACQYERPEGNLLGITRCFRQGEGAGVQKPGTYLLVPTRFAGETGIFRVNQDSGEMSICFVREVNPQGGSTEPMVLCTPQAK